MNDSKARCRIPRAVRWTTPFVVAIGIVGCGGAESPSATTGAADASRVTARGGRTTRDRMISTIAITTMKLAAMRTRM